ncbi:MAG: hypothetical protein AAB668_03475 [Patescibacteria group bacterium]|mgnify:CR=1 FL=1
MKTSDSALIDLETEALDDDDDPEEAARTRRGWTKRLIVRDVVVRRLIETFIVFRLETCPVFQTRFERLRTETNYVVVRDLLFADGRERERFQRELKEIQKALGIPGADRLGLEPAVTDALPFLRRGRLVRTAMRRREIEAHARLVLAQLLALAPEERENRYALFASPRTARELVRDGAGRPEELGCSTRLMNRDGSIRPLAYEIVEELRYRILRQPTLLRVVSSQGECEAA